MAPNETGTASNQTSAHGKKPTGHTAGFKAGMSVGMIALGAIILFLAWWFLRSYCIRRSPRRNSPPPYKQHGVPFVPPTEDPYFDVNSTQPIQMYPGPSRSTVRIPAPTGNPYEALSPSRTASPASTVSNNYGAFPLGFAEGRMGV